MRRFVIPSAAVAALVVLAAAGQAQAHQCVEAQILHSPQRVHQGQRFRVRAAIENCGNEPTRYRIRLYLVGGDRRIPVGRARVGLHPGQTVRRTIRARVPRPPGD